MKNFVADYRGLSLLRDPRMGFIRSKVGAAIFVLLFPIFSFCLFGLIDRQPSPKEKVSLVETQQGFVQKTTTKNIGKHPGLTIGDSTRLFPWHAPSGTLVEIALISLLLGLVALVVVWSVSFHGLKWKSVGFLLLIGLYLVLVVVLSVDLLGYYPTREADPITGFAAIQKLTANLEHAYLLLGMLLMQSFTIAAVGVIYTQPLVPAYATTAERLDRHLKRAWKYTQLGMSITVAIAVGISLPILVGKTGLTLFNTILVVLFLLSGAGALVVFSALKIHYAGRYRREENLS
jgi:hypothetical protein